MLLDEAFNNISYTRSFNTLNQITGDPRNMKQLLKVKNEIFVKETQLLFGERFESDIVITAKRKQKSKEIFSTITNKQQPFRKSPILGHQPNKDRGQNDNMMFSKNHSQHTWKPGQKQDQNKYQPQFDTEVKLFHLKVVLPNKFLVLISVIQSKHSASTCNSPVFNKSNSRSPSSRETKSLLFKLGQTYTRSECPKYFSRI